jgi:predicted RNase H-like nuclease (RuvC/YqgF family)
MTDEQIEPPVRNAWMQNADTPLIICQKENERLHHLLGQIVDQREELRNQLENTRRMFAAAVESAGGSISVKAVHLIEVNDYLLTRRDGPQGDIIFETTRETA